MKSYLSSDTLTLSEKWRIEDSAREMLGVEIRRKRLLLNRTLKEISFDLCSASYICKIEKNQIAANKMVLREVCKRVEILPDHVELMFNLFDIIQQSISDYINGNNDIIASHVKKGRGLENYRYRILQFMYAISKDELYEAKTIFTELVQLKDMMDYDKTVFFVFAGILRYKEKNYQEVIDLLAMLPELVMSEDLVFLKTKYLFLASLMMSSHNTMLYYDSCVELLQKRGRYDLLEEVHYAACCYALRTNADALLDQVQRRLCLTLHINSIEIMKAYMNQDIDRLHALENAEMNDFCVILLGIMKGKDGQLEAMMHLGNSKDDYDYSANLLKYMAEGTEDKRLSFVQKVLPYYDEVDDAFARLYFLKEYTRLSLNRNHYKATCEALYTYLRK